MLPTENWRVDFDSRYPIYRQIIAQFSRALVRGELRAGDRISSIRDLAVALKVNTNTIQRAYQEMERDGLIYSQRGTGYFIMDDKEITVRVRKTMLNQTLEQFIEEMRALGYNDSDIMSEVEKHIKKGEE